MFWRTIGSSMSTSWPLRIERPKPETTRCDESPDRERSCFATEAWLPRVARWYPFGTTPRPE
jgi:hypothetical protein